MDDIYGDLDNYNEANLIEELRSENKELKFKLDEYTIAMDKLQKDFDHLSSEFKKLEMNYSSLLKTAKAEIERKSQMINSLNHEKDMMVLNAIQNKTIIPRNLLRSQVGGFQRSSFKDSKKCNREEADETSTKLNESEKDKQQNLKIAPKDNSSSNTDISSKSQECKGTSKMLDSNRQFKENCISTKGSSCKIRLRRKSMPATRQEDMSSLSGDENNCSSKNHRKESIHRQKVSSKKGSESSSIDDKYSSYKESSIETYNRSRYSKPHDSDKYQSKAAYDSDRYKNVSPDHLLRTATRNCTSRQYYSARYSDSNKYGYQPKSRDRRSNYDRMNDDRQSYYSDHRDYDIYHKRQYADRRDEQSSRHTYSDRLPGKHKYQSDYDHKSAKRMKTDTNHLRKDENAWQVDNNYTDEELFQKVIGDIQYTSCQSPDFMNTDYHLQEPVKEIRLTSESSLEDPRLKCGKYSLKSDDGIVKLVTANEQNIDLLPIDKSAWTVSDVSIPDDLKKAPDQEDTYEKTWDIIASKGLAQSTQLPSLDVNMTEMKQDKIKKSISFDILETDKNNDLELCPPEANTIESRKKEQKLNIKSKHKDIPVQDFKRVEKNKSHERERKSKRARKSSESIHQKTPVTNQITSVTSSDSTNVSATQEKECSRTDNTSSVEKEPSTLDKDKKVKNTTEKKLTNREIVAGDLEMSDETSDNNDCELKLKCTILPNPTTKNFEDETPKEKAVITFAQAIDKDRPLNTTSIVEMTNIEKGTNIKKQVINQKETEVIESNTKSSKPNNKHDIDENKIHETQISTQITTCPANSSKVSSEPCTDLNDSKKKAKKEKPNTSKRAAKGLQLKSDKKPKAMKDNELLSTPIKNKFTDLFGESNSLITPEDLGLTSCHQVLSARDTYTIISEDAQDAMDVVVSVERTTPGIQGSFCDQSDEHKEISNNIITLCTQEASNDANTAIVNLQNDVPKSGPNLEYQRVTTSEVAILPVLPETSEPDVFKTVVISSGVQPQTKQSDSPVPTSMEIINQLVQNKATLDAVNSLTALATSTPHKSFIEIDQKNPDVSSNSSDSRISSNANTVNDQSTKSISEPQNHDTPDVRLVLKRKRRVIKK